MKRGFNSKTGIAKTGNFSQITTKKWMKITKEAMK